MNLGEGLSSFMLREVLTASKELNSVNDRGWLGFVTIGAPRPAAAYCSSIELGFYIVFIAPHATISKVP